MHSYPCMRAALALAMLSLSACGADPDDPHASDDDDVQLLPVQAAPAVVPPSMLHLYDTSADGKPEIVASNGIEFVVNLEDSGAVGMVEDHGREIMIVTGMSVRVECSDGQSVQSDGRSTFAFRPTGIAKMEARCTSGSARSAVLVVEHADDPRDYGWKPRSSDIGHDRYHHSGFPVALTAPDGSVTRLSRTDERTLVASFTNGTSSTVRTSFSLGGQCPEGEKIVRSGSLAVAVGGSESIALQCEGAIAEQPLFTIDGWSPN